MLKIVLMVLVLENVRMARRSHCFVGIIRNMVAVPEGVPGLVRFFLIVGGFIHTELFATRVCFI